jgi:deoxyribonuclease-4
MSIAGGLHRSVERALAVDATALQVFVKSARQWRAVPLEPAAIDRFRRATSDSDLGACLLAHASYLINLASPRAELRKRSREALEVEVDRCAALGIPYLVVHPGSHDGAGERRGLERLTRELQRIFRASARRAALRREVTILLETTAGQGNALGASFDEIGWVLSNADCAERLGMCFDTCHALAAGYEFRDRRSYRATVRELDRVVGLEHLRAFHLNDSKHPLGSRRDRHEHIGRGEVGLEAFRLILNDRRFRRVPMVLETPKGEDLAEDRVNLGVLRAMIARRR